MIALPGNRQKRISDIGVAELVLSFNKYKILLTTRVVSVFRNLTSEWLRKCQRLTANSDVALPHAPNDALIGVRIPRGFVEDSLRTV